MNYLTLVRPLWEVLRLWGVLASPGAAPLEIPFSPVPYVGVS